MEFIINILINVLTSAGVFIVLGKIFETYITSRVQSAVQHGYDIKLEEYKLENEKRLKALLIADLVSEWLSNPSDKKTLNRLTFEAFIWLPKEIAIKLSSILSHAQSAPNVKELIADVRTLILGEEEKISHTTIIHFT